MRLLVVSLFPPLPADSGVKMRTWTVLRALAQEGHEVHLLCPGSPETTREAEAALAAVCARVEYTAEPAAFRRTPGKQIARLLSLPSALPATVVRARSRHFQNAIRDLAARGGAEAIVFEQSVAAVNLPAETRIPVIVDFHNADHIIYQRYAGYAANPSTRFYALLEAAKFTGWEMMIASRAAAAWACSAADRDVLQPVCSGLPMFVVPNVLDTEAYAPTGGERPFTLLFQGGMDWYPNQDAVDFFVREIFPRVREALPQTEFVVAGKNPPESLRRRTESVPRVRFTGALADLRHSTASAAVSVVPLRIGSGTRLKILEAAAMQKAIVSTSVGAEGLRFVAGEEILLADAPEPFAAAVVDLLKNADRRRRLGQAARRRVESDYTLDAARSAIRATFERLERNAVGPAAETRPPSGTETRVAGAFASGGRRTPIPAPAVKPREAAG